MPRDGKEVLDNKGPINEASIERMTRGKNMPIVKEVETSNIRKGKTKANSKGINLNAETSLWCKMKDVKKMDGIFVDQEDIIIENEVAIVEEVVAEGEEVAENEKEREEEDYIVNIVTAPKLSETRGSC
ncbi:hypothetical protein J1N35_005384 [Gossypium stocksii]|uniref:Uncharacterized protein n=1 Tax=Gossypium stocksii TaxID=47602 RepID=A0A9D4AIJ9_9ROSI|nr:hypothetical protein J1N35_005384 [Gossypium stocksii]